MKSRTKALSRRYVRSACIASLLLLASGVQVSIAQDTAAIAGEYSIWEDFEGGTVCPMTLENERTIGGYVLTGDDDCMVPFKLSDDPYAWFVDDEGKLVIIDVTRKVLVRFEPLQDGSFYAQRQAEGLENLNLTPE